MEEKERYLEEMIQRLEEEKREVLSRLVCQGLRGGQWETLSRKVTVELNILSAGNLHEIEKGRNVTTQFGNYLYLSLFKISFQMFLLSRRRSRKIVP